MINLNALLKQCEEVVNDPNKDQFLTFYLSYRALQGSGWEPFLHCIEVEDEGPTIVRIKLDAHRAISVIHVLLKEKENN